LEYHAITCSQKKVPIEQQSHFAVLREKESLLAVICDGKGEIPSESRAAHVALECATKAFKEDHGHFSNPKDRLLEICKIADQEVAKLQKTNDTPFDSTISILYLQERKAHWIHVGNTRIYRIRHNRIMERTRDHTTTDAILEKSAQKTASKITPEKKQTHRTLGAPQELRPSYASSDIDDGDAFLICTSAFWEKIPSYEIEHFFENQSGQDELNKLVEKMASQHPSEESSITATVIYCGPYEPQRRNRSSALFLWILAILLLAGIALSFPLFIHPENKPPAPNNPPAPASSPVSTDQAIPAGNTTVTPATEPVTDTP